MDTAKESKSIQKARKKVKQNLKCQSKKVRTRMLRKISCLLQAQMMNCNKEELEQFRGGSISLDSKNSAPVQSPFINQLREQLDREHTRCAKMCQIKKSTRSPQKTRNQALNRQPKKSPSRSVKTGSVRQ